jgi:predicted permease
VLRDFRFAFRQLRQSQGFTVTAVLTLALGIGANTAIFTLIDAVMLRSLPVADPAQLYRLGDTSDCCVVGGYRQHVSIFSYPLYVSLRDHTPELRSMAAFQAGHSGVGVRRGSGPSQASTDEYVSGNYFTTLGVLPFAGRMFTNQDDRPGAPPVAVMSYHAWERYGNDPAIVGSTLYIEGAAVTVAGVAPPGFFGDTLSPVPPDFWIPLNAEPVIRGRNSLLTASDQQWLYIIGRIRPDVASSVASIPALESRVNIEVKQWFLENDPPRDANGKRQFDAMRLTVTPAGSGIQTLRDTYRNDLRLLIEITGLVLLIACANLANLQLARGTAQAAQVSIRAALGASRGRLLRQALAESILLAVLGGSAGLLLAMGLASFLIRLVFPGVQYFPIDTAPSAPVLAFTFGLSFLTGIVFGVAPAWKAARVDPADALRGIGRSAAGGSTLPQRSLVVIQAALSLVLLAGAGMMARTLSNLRNQSFGYEPAGRMVAHVNASLSGYSPEKIGAVYRDIERGLKQIPGVRNASLSLYSPMSGDNWQTGASLEGQPNRMISPVWDRVSPSFFDTLGAHITAGRGFDDRDQPDSRQVAVVNQAFAKLAFPDQNPLGKHFGLGGWERRNDFEIVGVVDNFRHRDLRNPAAPMFFIPLLQMSEKQWQDRGQARSNMINDIELYVSGDAPGLSEKIERLFAQTDPNLTLLRLNTFEELLTLQMSHTNLITRLIELLGLLAAALACVGLYGVTAYAVARRTGEIGIRAALGATRAQVARMVLAGAMAQIGVALAVGLPASWAAGRVLETLLFGVKNGDPLVLGGACAALSFAAVLASLIPAWRASTIDPAQALRS